MHRPQTSSHAATEGSKGEGAPTTEVMLPLGDASLTAKREHSHDYSLMGSDMSRATIGSMVNEATVASRAPSGTRAAAESDAAPIPQRLRSRLPGNPTPVAPPLPSSVPPDQSTNQLTRVRAAMDAAMMPFRGLQRTADSVPHMRPISEEGASTATASGGEGGVPKQRSASAQASWGRPDGRQGYFPQVGGSRQQLGRGIYQQPPRAASPLSRSQSSRSPSPAPPPRAASPLSHSQSSRSPSPASQRWATATGSLNLPSSERRVSTSDRRRAERQQQREREQQQAGPTRHRSPAAERWGQAVSGGLGISQNPPSPLDAFGRLLLPDGSSKSSAPRSFAAQRRMEKQQSVARSRWVNVALYALW